MEKIFEKKSAHIGLWPVFISKIIGIWISFAIFSIFIPIIPLLAIKTGLPLYYISVVGISAYFFIKDNPTQWDHFIKIDYEEKLIKLDNATFSFDSVKWISATQYESFIFSTYYKISMQNHQGKMQKLIALKSPKEYSELLSAFHKTGIKVN